MSSSPITPLPHLHPQSPDRLHDVPAHFGFTGRRIIFSITKTATAASKAGATAQRIASKLTGAPNSWNPKIVKPAAAGMSSGIQQTAHAATAAIAAKIIFFIISSSDKTERLPIS
jgi:hypothetical protein